MKMVTCINSSSENDAASQVDKTAQVSERYFDKEGHLLVCHYPYIYEQNAETAKRHGKDLSLLRPNDSLEKFFEGKGSPYR